MKTLKITLLVLLLLGLATAVYLLFFAYKLEENKLAELQTQHLKIEVLHSKINTDSLRNIYNTISENLNFIQQHTDTITKETALHLASYQSVQKPLSAIINNNSKIAAELQSINFVLNKIKPDLEAKNHPANVFKANLNAEAQKLNLIELELAKIDSFLKKTYLIYKESDCKVEQMTTKMTQK